MSYVVKIDCYEGPLELLLQLISKSKLSIEEVSLSEITGQYMACIENMQKLDMEVASEFLLMASTLLYIKSCKVLPESKTLIEESEKTIEVEIKNRLIEYSNIKEAASLLAEKASISSGSYYRIPLKSDIVPTELSDQLMSDPSKISEAISRIAVKLKRNAKVPVVHTVNRDTKSFKTRIFELRHFFRSCKQISFSELFSAQRNREEVVLTFVALLKMASDGMLELLQTSSFADVVIRRRKGY